MGANTCHGEVVGANGIFVDATKHINGTVEVLATFECNSCHGDTAKDPSDILSSAPPIDASGASESAAIGAHQVHLSPSAWRAPVACESCHLVPVDMNEAGHMDTALPAEVDMSAAPADARWSGMVSYDSDTGSCSVYCHNPKPEDLSAGKKDVSWDASFSLGCTGCHGYPPADSHDPAHTTCSMCHSNGGLSQPAQHVNGSVDTDASGVACGTCHALPPTPIHVQRSDCETCHGEVIGPDLVFVDESKHLNGTVEVLATFECNTCHGDAAKDPTDILNAAPPIDTSGASDSSAVGAHAAHLAVADWRAPVACESCHLVPADMLDEAHMDTARPAEVDMNSAPADVAWTGTLSYDGTTGGCTVYCHNPDPADTSSAKQDVVWDTATDLACTGCHGSPPLGGGHPGSNKCTNCHWRGGSDVPANHVNGVLELY